MIRRLLCLFRGHSMRLRGVLVSSEDYRDGTVRSPGSLIWSCRRCGWIPEPFMGVGDSHPFKPLTARELEELRLFSEGKDVVADPV